MGTLECIKELFDLTIDPPEVAEKRHKHVNETILKMSNNGYLKQIWRIFFSI